MAVPLSLLSQLSDPTPVGWINRDDSSRPNTDFRPHACGVDIAKTRRQNSLRFSDPTPVGWIPWGTRVAGFVRFQTPRLWGGLFPSIPTPTEIFQTPRLWGGCGRPGWHPGQPLSDPTPVGWIRRRSTGSKTKSFRPHACGVDEVGSMKSEV